MCSEETTAVSGEPTVFSWLSAVCSSELTALSEEATVARSSELTALSEEATVGSWSTALTKRRLSALRS